MAGDHLQPQQYEVQRCRRAVLALIAKIRHCNEVELQELLKSIRNANSLAEAKQQALDLDYC
ncbi:uncharacterized protein N7498_001644 [Penicillium cinerascens]|uniref:Uncharacterized protein n=1 Tax=Penicillium cinerascens TaxID=70096 RepID=A0A9W9TA54_9EURO|nr:uncharacterized protein N7498_001644 [Penicillium cinerascens]KAJ5215237.1 hypothetical protein N7498_001644 [Penicillium cinerascens]